MCYSNCPYEIYGGDSWGNCGNGKMQGTPLSHCCDNDTEENENEEVRSDD